MIYVVVRRFFETVVLGMISSLPAYWFLRSGSVVMNPERSILLFTFTAVIFGVLSIHFFKRCMFAVLYEPEYKKANLFAFGAAFVVNMFFLFFENKEVYILFFSYTKCVKALTPGSLAPELRTLISSCVFWLLYIAEMLTCPKLFKRQIRIIRECANDYQYDED